MKVFEYSYRTLRLSAITLRYLAERFWYSC